MQPGEAPTNASTEVSPGLPRSTPCPCGRSSQALLFWSLPVSGSGLRHCVSRQPLPTQLQLKFRRKQSPRSSWPAALFLPTHPITRNRLPRLPNFVHASTRASSRRDHLKLSPRSIRFFSLPSIGGFLHPVIKQSKMDFSDSL